MNIKKQISLDLDIPEKLINDALYMSRRHVKIFKIKKRNGGYRKIYHPSKKLKTIQYWLINNILNKLPIHEAAVAYRKNISILDNAKLHSHGCFFLKMDLKNFFPSINYLDLRPMLEKWHETSKPTWSFDSNTENLIKHACFFEDDYLAVGYPSSPLISNIVMYNFDVSVTQLISQEKFGNMLYSRYADDFIFSTDKKGVCKEASLEISQIVKNSISPVLKINHLKTKLSSSSGGSASVTGLKICNNGHITILRKQKDHIRLLLSLYSKGDLNVDEHIKLRGHLSYCHHVAPAFYSSLSNKYFKEIYKLRNENL